MTLSPGRIGMAVTLVLLALVYSVSIQDAVAASADKLDKGVKVGEAIPHTLAAKDQNNKAKDFRSLKLKRGLIILFSRSLDW